MRFARIDQSPIARWWWTVDRWSLVALGVLIAFGVVLSLAASPAVAERLGYDELHFFRRHVAALPFAVGLLFIVSLQPPRTVRRLAVIGFVVSLAMLALTFVVGIEIKGARRWIELAGAVACSPRNSSSRPLPWSPPGCSPSKSCNRGFPGNLHRRRAAPRRSSAMLVKQPDIGMAVVVALVWFAQFYMAGLRLYWVVLGGIAGLGGLAGAYFWLPHVRLRVDQFINPAAGDSYQVNRSLEAFANGGLWGRGPGEGTVKYDLPDAHADFVFAVAGEEFGLIVCLAVVGLFAFIVLRGFSRLSQEGNLFVLLAGDRPVRPVRAAGRHQHGLEPAPDADQRA